MAVKGLSLRTNSSAGDLLEDWLEEAEECSWLVERYSRVAEAGLVRKAEVEGHYLDFLTELMAVEVVEVEHSACWSERMLFDRLEVAEEVSSLVSSNSRRTALAQVVAVLS